MTGEPPVSRYRMEILLAGILLLSAFLNLWNIWNLGYTNTYYAAAVRSMLANPGVMFFNSFDAGGFITVDKPPVGLWVQAASAVLFGFSGWALVLPQALAGVGSVALIYCIVSRPFGKPAGLVAAFALATCPILVAVCRNETPDGLLIFVILLAVWAALKAARENSLPWLLVAVTFVGIGFNIKMIQAFIVVPAILAVYLLGAGGVPMKSRLIHIGLALALLLVVSLSWAVVIDAIPADQRPYIGGSGDNTVMGLIINYNGIHRLESDGQFPGKGSGIDAGAGGIPGMASSRNQSSGPQEIEGMPPAGGTGQPVSSSQYSAGGVQPGSQQGSLASAPSRNQSGLARTDRPASYTPGMAWQGMPAAPGSMGSMPGTQGMSGAPGGRTGGGMDDTGNPGILRLFTSGLYGQLTWLLPFALIGLLAWIRRPAEWTLKGVDDAGYFSEKGLTILAMCLWLFPGLIYFSFTTGFWHTYYIATIAPPLAALTGIGAAGMYTAYMQGSRTGWILIAAIAVTAIAQVLFLLSSTLSGSAILVLALATAIIIVTTALAVLFLSHRVVRDPVKTLTVALAVGLLFVAPCIWAGVTVMSGSGNFLPVAGPQQGRGTGGGPGGDGRFGSADSGSGLTDYLVSHKSWERWIVAVASSNEASGIILSTGEPVMALGGFSGSDQTLSTSDLTTLVDSGAIRYFYLSSSGDRGGMGGSSGNAAVTSWVSTHCSAIPASDYGGTAYSGDSGTGMQGSAGSGKVLYDCRNTTA